VIFGFVKVTFDVAAKFVPDPIITSAGMVAPRVPLDGAALVI
jgi:hypothetical protein